MSRKGDCWDNAVVDSFFATLKIERVYQRPRPRKREAKEAIGGCIAGFYSSSRGRSILGGRSPNGSESLMETGSQLAA